jgi:hypothetical protein
MSKDLDHAFPISPGILWDCMGFFSGVLWEKPCIVMAITKEFMEILWDCMDYSMGIL